MNNLCNNCIHKDVCGRYAATWGMKSCEHFREMPKKGKWEHAPDGAEYCSRCGCYPDEEENHEYNFCPECGADMRGNEDGKE